MPQPDATIRPSDPPAPGPGVPARQSPFPPAGPIDAAVAADQHLRTLMHEVANLTDGSLRYVRLARHGMTRHKAETPADRQIRAYLDAADHALAHLADLVRQVSGIGRAAPGRGVTLARQIAGSMPLRQCIEHAAEVLRPMADEHRVRITLELSPSVDMAPPAPLYPVVVNALRNAVEAIASLGPGAGGAVTVRAEIADRFEGPAPRELRLEITDDGPGPPANPDLRRRVFDLGCSTKPGGMGVGLALARDIVRELGGSIELVSARREQPGRPGARLALRYPIRHTNVPDSAAA
ncbi:MAG: hypothetical protein IBJ11_07765 [Phycisphaerales bacterium]|nr:hypothetical protein [Phycisphaerales bacterium]